MLLLKEFFNGEITNCLSNRQRKQAVHSDLMLEVINLLSNRFKPDPTMIKKRIESLMEREYLERVDGERQTYRYLVSLSLYHTLCILCLLFVQNSRPKSTHPSWLHNVCVLSRVLSVFFPLFLLSRCYLGFRPACRYFVLFFYSKASLG